MHSVASGTPTRISSNWWAIGKRGGHPSWADPPRSSLRKRPCRGREERSMIGRRGWLRNASGGGLAAWAGLGGGHRDTRPGCRRQEGCNERPVHGPKTDAIDEQERVPPGVRPGRIRSSRPTSGSTKSSPRWRCPPPAGPDRRRRPWTFDRRHRSGRHPQDRSLGTDPCGRHGPSRVVHQGDDGDPDRDARRRGITAPEFHDRPQVFPGAAVADGPAIPGRDVVAPHDPSRGVAARRFLVVPARQDADRVPPGDRAETCSPPPLAPNRGPPTATPTSAMCCWD